MFASKLRNLFTSKAKTRLLALTKENSPFKNYFKINGSTLPKSNKVRKMRMKETIESSYILSTLVRLAIFSIGIDIDLI